MVSQVLVSATFLEAPARFQSHQPLEPLAGGSAQLERRNPETSEEVCHQTVLRVLFQTGVPILRMAKPRLDPLEGWASSPGTATGSGKALGPVPSQALPQWVEEEADLLIGAPRKGADISLGEIRSSSKGEKKGKRDILNLKQKAIRSPSVCLDLCMSQCMSFFFS